MKGSKESKTGLTAHRNRDQFLKPRASHKRGPSPSPRRIFLLISIIPPTQFLKQEQSLATKRGIRYREIASIDIRVLEFLCEKSRKIDNKNVERLKKKFRKEECQPLPLQNHVPIEISQQQLDIILAKSGVSTKTLYKDPSNNYLKLKLPLGFRLKYLYSRYRILTAAAVLSLEEQR